MKITCSMCKKRRNPMTGRNLEIRFRGAIRGELTYRPNKPICQKCANILHEKLSKAVWEFVKEAKK